MVAADIVRRSWRGELRADGAGGGGRVLRGYAALYNSLSEDLGGFREMIAPGAFAHAFEAGADIRALWNHDTGLVLGRTTAGTLKLRDDASGLYVEIHPPDTTWANDALESVRRGDVNQMSFGFAVVHDSWADGKGGLPVRTLLEVKLYEVSPVAIPAYAETSVSARSRMTEGARSGMANLYERRLKLLSLRARAQGR